MQLESCGIFLGKQQKKQRLRFWKQILEISCEKEQVICRNLARQIYEALFSLFPPHWVNEPRDAVTAEQLYGLLLSEPHFVCSCIKCIGSAIIVTFSSFS